MTVSNLPGPSPYDNDSDIDEMLEYYEYILAVTWRQVPSNIGPIDSEDVAQEAFMKLWIISQKQPIENPKAYIRRIVHTTVVDMVRKFKPHLYQALPVDEDGEIQEGNLVVIPGAELGDPEAILEEKEAVEELMGELVDVVSELRPRQMHSTICTLKDRVDDLLQFVDALQEKGIESELQWPLGTTERQRLQASYSPAKRKVASFIGVDLSLYK
jgi:DNA-directed RNA polymerase specialized sigma24 family protein